MCTTSSSSLPPSQTVLFPFRLHEATNSVFTFNASPKPEMALTFPPRPSPPRPKKRRRATADIDGEHSCVYKKKRRLRLFLITSRLSPEFSYPATNIVDRGSSKIAVWAKQKALGRNLLRKAAILNRIRRRAMTARGARQGLASLVEQEREQKQLELAKLAFVYGSHDTHTRPVLQMPPSFPPTTGIRVGEHFKISGDPASSPRPSSPNFSSSSSGENRRYEASPNRSPNDAYASSYPLPRAQIPRRPYIPLPPSPLGLSNYDAFDLEDDIPDPYAHLDDEDQFAELGEDMIETDASSSSANTTASYTSTLSTAPTVPNEPAKTPPQMIYSDFNILDPGEPVVGDYDQIEEGADAIWPNALAPSAPAASTEYPPQRPVSCSPNFPALFATSSDITPLQGSLRNLEFSEMLDKKDEEIKRERERQKSLMFLRFNS